MNSHTRRHVVIIEDTPEPREVMAMLLEHAGFAVTLAADGIEGLSAIRASRPALVVCDIQMPRLDGYGVIAAIRADVALAALPVVAVTAYTSQHDRERVLRAGFTSFMAKPIVAADFAHQIAAHIPE